VNLSTRIALTFAAILGALTLSAGVAYATSDSGPARRGQPCDVAGSYARDRSGDLYVCEQRKDDRCNVWHAAAPRPGDWGKPSPCVCPSKSPSVSASSSPKPSVSPSKSPSTSASPSKPASQSPTKSASASPSPTTANPSPSNVAVTLPVTGESNTLLLLSWSAVLIGAGLGLLVFAKSRRRAT
jgi:LPXTG-motif cell wall-anchored protein